MIDFLMMTKPMPLLLLSMPGQSQSILLWEVLRNLRSSINFQGFTEIQIVKFKDFFSFFKFTFVTRKWEDKNATIELVTRNEIKYFLTSSNSKTKKGKFNHWVSNLKRNYAFFKFELETRKWSKKCLTIELVTWIYFFYFFASS